MLNLRIRSRYIFRYSKSLLKKQHLIFNYVLYINISRHPLKELIQPIYILDKYFFKKRYIFTSPFPYLHKLPFNHFYFRKAHKEGRISQHSFKNSIRSITLTFFFLSFHRYAKRISPTFRERLSTIPASNGGGAFAGLFPG